MRGEERKGHAIVGDIDLLCLRDDGVVEEPFPERISASNASFRLPVGATLSLVGAIVLLVGATLLLVGATLLLVGATLLLVGAILAACRCDACSLVGATLAGFVGALQRFVAPI